ncbi:MAG: entericidin A/B family lipoprotein [Pseudomonadota bacterium]
MHKVVLILAIGLLAACNTVQGVGQDISESGRSIEKAAQ